MSRENPKRPTAKWPTKRRDKPLTNRERKLFELVAKGKTLTDAAIEAGYSDKFPAQAGFQAIENIKQKAPSLFERHGLDDDTFIEKHIKPALNAMEVKVFRSEDEIIYSKPLIAWGPRVQMNRLVAEMKGLVVKEQETPNTGIKVVIINSSHRPVRPVQATTIPHVPGLRPPEEARE